MTTTEPRGVLTAPGPTPDRPTLCAMCHAGLVVDAGRYELAHEITCPAGGATDDQG